MPTIGDLLQKQSLPLEAKIVSSQMRIREFYERLDGQVYVAFSGGKDSTVTAALVKSIYPDVPLVFYDTGLEFPEIRKFSLQMGATLIRPEHSFLDIVTQRGYQLIGKETAGAIEYARIIKNGSNDRKLVKNIESKRKELTGVLNKPGKKTRFDRVHWALLAMESDFLISAKCCFYMKKSLSGKYSRKNGIYPIVGTTAEESAMRTQAWLQTGCNSFDEGHTMSRPISFWTEQDILTYIRDRKIPYCSVYGEIVEEEKNTFFGEKPCLKCTGYRRTGCIFCGFGLHLDPGESRFERLAKTHPRQYEYCIGGGEYIDNPHYDRSAPKRDGDWRNWNPKKIWVPNKKGLGLKHVFDQVNAIYGEPMLRY